jgi:hypothetical protein
VRDDVYPLTKAERRATRASWRQFSGRERMEAGRLAERGLPAPSPELSAAALQWGQYMLRRTWSNRIPRSGLVVAGLTAAGLGLISQLAIGNGWVLVGCGLVAAACGWLTWSLRRLAHDLVRANSVVPRPEDAAAGRPDH